MLRSLWTAKTGLDAQQTSLDTISNNLANVSTTAYKRARPIFEDLLYQNIRSAGLTENSGTNTAGDETYIPADCKREMVLELLLLSGSTVPVHFCKVLIPWTWQLMGMVTLQFKLVMVLHTLARVTLCAIQTEIL
jgi:hypothetical protein